MDLAHRPEERPIVCSKHKSRCWRWGKTATLLLLPLHPSHHLHARHSGEGLQPKSLPRIVSQQPSLLLFHHLLLTESIPTYPLSVRAKRATPQADPSWRFSFKSSWQPILKKLAASTLYYSPLATAKRSAYFATVTRRSTASEGILSGGRFTGRSALGRNTSLKVPNKKRFSTDFKSKPLLSSSTNVTSGKKQNTPRKFL
jgi:hypothetical protein